MPKKLRPSVLRELADCRYEREMAEYRDRLAAEETAEFNRLADDTYATSLGLPADLPQHTRDVLKHTMAMDRVGPSMPKRSEIYSKYGVE